MEGWTLALRLLVGLVQNTPARIWIAEFKKELSSFEEDVLASP